MISCTDEKDISIYQSTKSFISLITKFKVLKKDVDFIILPKASNIGADELASIVVDKANQNLSNNSIIFKEFNIENDLLGLNGELKDLIKMYPEGNNNQAYNSILERYKILKNLQDMHILPPIDEN